MSILDGILADDADYAFAGDGAGFSETVTYTPIGAAALSDGAIVFREPPLAVPDSGGKFAPQLKVFIRMNFGGGLTSIDAALRDTITVAERQNGAPSVHVIAEVLSQDPGGWLLRLR
jgi:hypothetical protein